MALPTDSIGPFDVRTDDLIHIAPDQAVELFRQLLILEAIKAGIPVIGVDVPSAINVADGGIDAEISVPIGLTLPAGLLFNGATSYQIKTGSFSASTESDIRSLLVQPRFARGSQPRTKDQLQPRVLSCFEKGGTFAVVLFGSDSVGQTDNFGVTQIRRFMSDIDPTFANVDVHLIRANQLCSAIKLLAPGVALRLNRAQGYDDAIFHDLTFMAESCDLALEDYRLTENLDKATRQITSAADQVNGFQHVRVLGDAGAGKTHLMYRALEVSQLAGCVLYCSDPERAVSSGPLEALRNMAPHTTIVLVADECTQEIAEEIAVLFKRRATKMLLVTAHNVAEQSHVNTQIVEVPRLEQPVVAEIFKGYGIPTDTAEWLASLCEGSPRAAHKLGEYIQSNPDQQSSDHLSHLDELWERIVCAPHNVDSPEGRDRLAVMRTLALFRQIAWETAEGPSVQTAVLAAIRQLDQAFSQLKLTSIVKELRRRRVLQGPRTLLISPKLLHVAMWKSWFEQYGQMIDVKKLREGLEPRMQEHFDAMLMFVQESKAATAWADHLMGQGGMFASLEGYKKPGDASLFFAIAQAKPKAALRRFATALGAETVGDRQDFKGDARRTAIDRLEQLAVPAETFFEAADCLLLLAESENESWSNNSTGVFISLFSLGYGPVAASELPPVNKVDYLYKLLHSEVPFYRSIAIDALNKSLDPFMSRTSIEEVIGLRRLPERWKPATYRELYDAYAAHVTLLEDAIDYLPEVEAKEAGKIILSHVRTLILIPPLADRVLAFLRRAAELPSLREKSIEVMVATLHYEAKELPEDVKVKLEAIRSELTESSFTNKLRRHAGMKLLEDHFNSEGEYQDATAPELGQLAVSVVSNPEILGSELEWLVSDEAKNGYEFGQILGQVDQFKLWPAIFSAWIDAGSDRSDYFIGGYLAACRAKNLVWWENVIEGLLANPELRSFVPTLVWRSGMSDRIARVLLMMAKQGDIDPREFRLFIYGGVINQIPLGVVEEIVDLLLQDDSVSSLGVAMEIIDSRLRGSVSERSVWTTRIENVLNARLFVEGHTEKQPNSMLVYHWNEMALRLLDLNPDAGVRLAARCIANFANVNSVTAGFNPESLKFLSGAAKANPAYVWAAISSRLDSQRRELGTWHLLNWLRGGRSIRGDGDSPLDFIPTSIIFAWIDVDPTERAWILAEHCPPVVSTPEEPTTFARQMLERYGLIEQVRRSLHANNYSEGWTGPASDHYRRKLTALLEHLRIETDPNVRIWLNEHREQLENSIQREVERELRESEY